VRPCPAAAAGRSAPRRARCEGVHVGRRGGWQPRGLLRRQVGAVPMTAPVRVSVALSAARAMPKSAIFTVPSRASRRFPGLMSRWTRPAPWACANPSATCRARSSTRPGGSGPVASASASVPPSTHSITMNGRSPFSPTSKTWTILRCPSRAARRASRRNRSRKLGVGGEVVGQHLDSDRAAEAAVLGAVDGGHASVADDVAEVIAALAPESVSRPCRGHTPAHEDESPGRCHC